PPGELDVMRDVRFLAIQLVRLHDETVHVPGDELDDEKASHGWNRRGNKPHWPWGKEEVHPGDAGSDDEGDTNDRQAAENHVRIGVGDASKGGVICHDFVETAKPGSSGDYQEKEGDRAGKPPPGRRRRSEFVLMEEPRA